MNIWAFMEGYDRELDEDEFDQRLWDFMVGDEFEFNGQFEEFLKSYGLKDAHEFLRIIRNKKRNGIVV